MKSVIADGTRRMATKYVQHVPPCTEANQFVALAHVGHHQRTVSFSEKKVKRKRKGSNTKKQYQCPK
jgi:hypothetical protein